MSSVWKNELSLKSFPVAISAGIWKGKIISGLRLECINFSTALSFDSSLFSAVNTQLHPGNFRGRIAPCNLFYWINQISKSPGIQGAQTGAIVVEVFNLRYSVSSARWSIQTRLFYQPFLQVFFIDLTTIPSSFFLFLVLLHWHLSDVKIYWSFPIISNYTGPTCPVLLWRMESAWDLSFCAFNVISFTKVLQCNYHPTLQMQNEIRWNWKVGFLFASHFFK